MHALEAAGSVPAVERQRYGHLVEQIMLETRSRALRNQAALSLIDLDRREAGASFDRLLRLPEIAGSAGTLLFAMEELQLPVSLPAIQNIVANGSYEARAMLVNMIDGGFVQGYGLAERESIRENLRAIVSAGDEEAGEAAKLALAYFDDGPAS